MDEERAYKLIEPFIKDNSISLRVFYHVFDFLREKEQLEVLKLIEKKLGITVVGDEEELLADVECDEIDDQEFDKYYNKDAFVNEYYNDIKDVDYREANETLCALIQSGDESAKEALCLKNKRLVYKYAFAYHKFYGNKLDLEDLAQVGYIGLIKGADKFDLSKGNTFSTYAVFWIKQAITRELIDKGFTIRLPVHVFEKINKLVKLDNKYDALGYSFTERVDLLSEDMSIPTEKVLELFAIKYQYLSISSLDVPVGESEETPLLEFIGDSSIDESDYEASMIEFRKLLEGYLETLTEREQLVLRLRYGFDDGTPRTLEVVGKRLGVTRERVRQIESKALRKLSFKMKPEDFIGFFE